MKKIIKAYRNTLDGVFYTDLHTSVIESIKQAYSLATMKYIIGYDKPFSMSATFYFGKSCHEYKLPLDWAQAEESLIEHCKSLANINELHMANIYIAADNPSTGELVHTHCWTNECNIIVD